MQLNEPGAAPARKPRYSRALPQSGRRFTIPRSWDELPIASIDCHDRVFIAILEKHGFPIESPVPLVGRYSNGRPWSAEELEACVSAHDDGVPVALMSAALNRNPQDIIYRLLDRCSGEAGGFKEVGLRSARKWDERVLSVARDLFDAGLAAWRIAALLRIDFESAEKVLYKGRHDYGHAKKNPFAICTDHKQAVNRAVLQHTERPNRVLDAFAGEGRFANLVLETFPEANITCVEADPTTYARAMQQAWPPNVSWFSADNLSVLRDSARSSLKYDVLDLDPFVTCREQIDLIWEVLAPTANLFITFGGEYRRSFIRTNRKAIARRYGFSNDVLSNSEYLEVVPAFFLGWVAAQASKNGFIFDISYAVRYANNCRFWTRTTKAGKAECDTWFKAHVTAADGGFRWTDMVMPRFSEVRNAKTALLPKIGANAGRGWSQNDNSHNQIELAI